MGDLDEGWVVWVVSMWFLSIPADIVVLMLLCLVVVSPVFGWEKSTVVCRYALQTATK